MIAATLPGTNSDQLCDSTVPGALAGCDNIAVYATGYTADPGSLPYHAGKVLWIDQAGTSPSSDVIDVEPGTVTPAEAGEWVAEHDQVSGKPPIVYTMKSWWPATKAAVAADAPGADVRWWIANPGGGMVAGADATQTYWGSDIDKSQTTAHFWEGR